MREGEEALQVQGPKPFLLRLQLSDPGLGFGDEVQGPFRELLQAPCPVVELPGVFLGGEGGVQGDFHGLPVKALEDHLIRPLGYLLEPGEEEVGPPPQGFGLLQAL